MKKLLIFPFNGNAKEALDCIGDEFEVLAFIDDDASMQGSIYEGIPIKDRAAFSEFQDALVLAVPGSVKNQSRLKEIISSLPVSDDRWACIIHPSAQISKKADLGKNVLIMAGTVITREAEIGNHCCILPNCVIHHNSKLGDYCTLAAGVLVAGHTKVGQGVYIGAGSNLKDNIEIGEGALIGMGSNVIRKVKPGTTVVGNPAVEIR